MDAGQSLQTKNRRARMGVLALGIVLLLLPLTASSCGAAKERVRPTLTTQEASVALDVVISRVEAPDISGEVGTSRLRFFQSVILDGHEYPATPGLRDARHALERSDAQGFCKAAAAIIANTFVNKTMERADLDAVAVAAWETDRHDPQLVFLGRPGGEVAIMGSPAVLTAEEVPVEGVIMSRLWKDDALALMDIVYGLGQHCVDASKTDGE